MASADFSGVPWDPAAPIWEEQDEDPHAYEAWESEDCGAGGTTTTGLVLESGLILEGTITT